jgi:hypothetical protein
MIFTPLSPPIAFMTWNLDAGILLPTLLLVRLVIRARELDLKVSFAGDVILHVVVVLVMMSNFENNSKLITSRVVSNTASYLGRPGFDK